MLFSQLIRELQKLKVAYGAVVLLVGLFGCGDRARCVRHATAKVLVPATPVIAVNVGGSFFVYPAVPEHYENRSVCVEREVEK